MLFYENELNYAHFFNNKVKLYLALFNISFQQQNLVSIKIDFVPCWDVFSQLNAN